MKSETLALPRAAPKRKEGEIPYLNEYGVFTQLESDGTARRVNPFEGRSIGRKTAETEHGSIPVARALLYRINDLGEKEFLLQKRSETKSLWGGHWEATIVETGEFRSDDPNEIETPEMTVGRGLSEELKIDPSKIEFTPKEVRKWDNRNGSQDENGPRIQSIISTFFGYYDGSFVIDSKELAEARYVRATDLQVMLQDDTTKITPALRLLFKEHEELLPR